jgi:hypothetical protein
VEDHLDKAGLLVKRADLMAPVPIPEGQGAVWPGALTTWITAEVVLTFEQADRGMFEALRTLPWVLSQAQAESIAGVAEGLRACLGPRFLLIVPGDAQAWWTTEGKEKYGHAVLWQVG